jgi:hypothetical protein
MNKFLVGAALTALGCGLAPSAHAESVVFEQSGLISGSQSFVFNFNAPSAGTMTAKLTNLAWPERLSSLSFAASTATSVLTTLSDAGSIQFSVSGPGAYYAHVAGVAQGALDVGLYSLRITFDSGVSPVPLPAALPLLLAALASGAGLLRRRAILPSQSPATL